MVKAIKELNFGEVGYWALYLTGTMAIFEAYKLTPEAVGGVLPWIFVEAIRFSLGFLIQIAIWPKGIGRSILKE